MNLNFTLSITITDKGFKPLVHMLLLLLMLVLTACGTTGGDLPTLAVLPTQTTGPTNTPLSAESTATLEPSTVPSETPLIPLLSSAEAATQAAQVVPNFTPAPTPELSSLIGGGVDLTSVSVGDSVSLIGTLTVEDGVVVVTDADGGSVRLDLPPALAETLLNKRVYVVGMATSIEDGVTLQLLSIQEMTESPTLSAVVEPPFAVTSESTAEALPSVDDMRLALNLTALAAYDQLIEQISGEIGARQWISVSGNPAVGWSYSFYDASDSSIVIYNVLLDGSVQVQPGIPPLGTSETFALDRAAITVDSDALLAAYVANGGADEPQTLVFLLQAVDAETVQWAVLDIEGIPQLAVDALSGDVVR